MSTAVLLTYAAPLRQLYMTGKTQDPALWLSAAEAAQAAADGNYDGSIRTTAELLEDLGSRTFLVRSQAAGTIGQRTADHASLLPTLHTMATSDPDIYQRLGACAALGTIRDPSSAPVLAGLFSDPDDRIRWRSAVALQGFTKTEKFAVVDTIMAAVAAMDAPILPLKTGDPLHMTQERMANSLFLRSGATYSGALVEHDLVGIDRDLLYPVIRTIANHPKSQVRGWLKEIYPYLNDADFVALADVIVDAALVQAPSDNNPNARTAGIKALRERGYAEGVPLGEITLRYFNSDKPYWTRPPIWREIETYAGSNTTVTPDPDIRGFMEYLISIDFETVSAQAVVDAIEADSLPIQLVPLKRIDWIFPDDPELTLPKNWTTLRVFASDLAKGDSVFHWRKVHGAGEVTFTPNGTAAAKDAMVFFDGTPGKYLFEVTMSDSRGLTEVSETVAVTLNQSDGGLPPNSAPTADAQSLTINQGTPTPIILSGSDPEGYALQFTITSPPAHGVLSGTAPFLTYTPTVGFTGSDSFTFVATDSEGQSDSASVALTVAEFASGVAVYEPFDYPVGPLHEVSGAQEVGFAGAWNAHSEITLAAESLEWGALTAIGGSIGNLTNITNFGGSRAISPAALADNGLLDDGSILWFSMILGGKDLSVALANNTFDTGSFRNWIQDDGLQAGSGVGIYLTNKTVTATHFRDAAAGSSLINGSWNDINGKVLTDQNRLVIGKISWGSGSDVVEIYLPKENLALPETPSSVLTVDVDQATFDTLTFNRSGIVTLDEIRFGSTYESVLQGTVAMSPDTGAPAPNPMAFTIAPTPDGPASIRMEAALAQDPMGVEYYFTNTAGGGHDSGWQEINVYRDSGLTPGVAYAYTVMARDKQLNSNVTAPSAEASAIIPVDGTVPDVTGMPQTNAETIISNADLAVGSVTDATEYSTTVPGGHVLSQTPVGGAAVPYGSDVNLVISIGPDPALPTLLPADIVDDQSGDPVVINVPMSYTLTFSEDMDDATVDASDFINVGDASISIGAITEISPGVFTVEVTPTTTGILRFAVASGALLNDVAGDSLHTVADIIDDTVILVTLPPTAVPNVVGLSQADAASALAAANLTVGTVWTIHDESIPAGEVIRQDPVADSSIPEQSPVDLVVSLGPGPDNTAPVITELNPVDSSINVAVDANLIVSFDEPIEVGSGEVVIYNLTDASEWTIQSTDSSQISVSDNILTINPSNDLAQGKAYAVRVGAGAVQDLAGNDFKGIDNRSFWNFSTVIEGRSGDHVPPAIADLTPVNNSEFVSLSDNLVITFSEAIMVIRGKIILKKLSGFSETVIDVSDSAQVIVIDDQLQINPTDDLDFNSFYAVQIESRAIFDLAGNSFPGISDDTTWTFFTGEIIDDIAPELNSTTPPDGATEVPHSTGLELSFDEVVTAGSGSLTLKNLSDATQTIIDIKDGSQVSVSGAKVTINPASYLGEGKDYAIRIDSGAITDLAENAFAGISDDTTWNFSTSANNPPNIVALSPAHQSPLVEVTRNLSVTFDEAIAPGTGNIRIKNLSSLEEVTIDINDPSQITVSGTELIIDPVSVLADTSDYAVLIDAGAVADLNGNTFTGIVKETTWNFSTRADLYGEVFREDFEVASGNPDVDVSDSLESTSGETGPKWVRNSAGFRGTYHGLVDDRSGMFTDPTGDQGYAFRRDSSGLTTAPGLIGSLTAGKVYTVTFNVAVDQSPYQGGTGYLVGLVTFEDGAAREDAIRIENGTSMVLASTSGTHEGADYLRVKFTYISDGVADAAVLGQDIAVRFDGRGVNGAGIIDNVAVSVTDATPPSGAPTLFGSDIVDDRNGSDVNDLAPVLYTVTFSEGMDAATIDAFDFSNAGTASVNIGAVSEISSLGVFALTVTPTSPGSLRLQVNPGAVLHDKSGMALDTSTAITDDTVITILNTVTVPDVVGLAQAAAESSIVSADLAVGSVGLSYSDTVPAGDVISQDPPGEAFAEKGSDVHLIVSLGVEPDTTDPVVIELLPLDDALEVSSGMNLVATFSEEIVAGTGSITLKNFSTATNTVIDITDSSQVTFSGDQLIIDPVADLGMQSIYAVRIDATAIKDPSGNRFAGINDDSTWNFTTEPVPDGAPLDHPLALSGGPYVVQMSGTLLLDGSASRPADGHTLTNYEWDLNDDGIFGEITGATPTAIDSATLIDTHGMSTGANTIWLRVTDSSGEQFATVTTVWLFETFTYTGVEGSWKLDTWNDAINWNDGNSAPPYDQIDVEIAAGKIPWVINATPAYTGNLILRSNAVLGIGPNSANTTTNALGTGTITMESGSNIIIRLDAVYTFNQAFILGGPATLRLSESSNGGGQTRTFAGGFTGDHALTLEGQNGNSANLDTANSFTSLTASVVGSDNWRVLANAAGSLGTGDVTINNTVNLIVNAADAMNSNGMLNLNGARGILRYASDTTKLILNADLTVAELWIGGLPQPAGEFTATSGLLDENGEALISGPGTLTVLNAQNIAPVFTSDPVTAADTFENFAYSDSIADSATDANGDILSYAKVSGPDWLTVGTDGSLSGTPTSADVGSNSFVISASDGSVTIQATLMIEVTESIVVSFDANGGTAATPASKQVGVGLTYGTLATTERAGDALIGWFTAASGGDLVTSESVVTATADHTLYAQWNTRPSVDAGADDTATMGEQPGWTPAQIATVAWYDAEDAATIAATDGAVSQWSDKSGNQRHLQQSSGSMQPVTGTRTINGVNVLDFTPNQNLFRDSGVSNMLPYGEATYVFHVVAHDRSDIMSSSIMFSLNTEDGFGTGGGALEMHTGTNNGSRVVLADEGGARITLTGGSFTTNTAYLQTTSYDRTAAAGMTATVWVDGTQLVSGSKAVRNENIANHFYVGATSSTYRGMDGTIGEVVIAHGLDEANRQKIEGYLAHKWGLAANLPVDHPYKDAAPTKTSATASLDGTVSDLEGDPISTTWTKVSGPGRVIFADASAVDTVAEFDTTGSYVLRLTADDSVGLASDDVTITVKDPPGPVASFQISGMPAQVTVGRGITGLTVTALDSNLNTATSFTGSVTLGGTAGISGISDDFVEGVLSGLVVTPEIVGAGLNLTVDDAVGHTGSVSFDVIAVYDAWKANHGLSGADAEPATILLPDGFANLQKFAFGMSPAVTYFNPLEFVPGGELTTPGAPRLMNFAQPAQANDERAVFTRLKNYVDAGLTYTVEFSADLKVWTPSATTPTVLTDGSSNQEHEVVSVPFPDSVPVQDGGDPRTPKFLRIVISNE